MNKNNIDYSELFYNKEIKAYDNYNEREIQFNIELNDLSGRPDCKVGRFGYNLWYRTRKALQYGKYKSRKLLEHAVEKLLQKNNFKIIGWVNKI